MSIDAERPVRNPAQVEALVEDTKDRIADAVLMKTARRAYDHEYARAILAAEGPEYIRKAEATQVAMAEKEAADEAEIAFHHAQREAGSLEKELFSWQAILKSVTAMWNATGGR